MCCINPPSGASGRRPFTGRGQLLACVSLSPPSARPPRRKSRRLQRQKKIRVHILIWAADTHHALTAYSIAAVVASSSTCSYCILSQHRSVFYYLPSSRATLHCYCIFSKCTPSYIMYNTSGTKNLFQFPPTVYYSTCTVCMPYTILYTVRPRTVLGTVR